MTDFSKYILKIKYKDKFFDFKNDQCNIRSFTYSINLNKDQKQYDNIEGKYLKQLFCTLNGNKTLVSRASAVLLKNYGVNRSISCILLETKISPFRQNFDYFLWKKEI